MTFLNFNFIKTFIFKNGFDVLIRRDTEIAFGLPTDSVDCHAWTVFQNVAEAQTAECLRLRAQLLVGE